MSESNGISDNSLKGRAGLVVISCVAIALGAGYGAHLHAQATATAAPVKTVAKSIKLADGFIKGAKVIHTLYSPTPANLVFLTLTAVKAIAKSAGKQSDKFRRISKGLKASEGAVSLVKYSSFLNYGAADPLEYVIKGYKFTKGAFNVFDGVNGARDAAVRGYGVVKGAMEGVSVVVKAAVLSKQVYGILIQSLGISHGAFRILVEEFDRTKDKEENEENGKSWRPGRDSRQRIRMGISCLQSRNGVYGINCEKGLFLKCLWVACADHGVYQSQGCDLDCIFSLSVPCPADNNESVFRYICSHK